MSDIALRISLATLNWDGVKSSSGFLFELVFSGFGNSSNSSLTFSSFALEEVEPDAPVEISGYIRVIKFEIINKESLILPVSNVAFSLSFVWVFLVTEGQKAF